MNDKTSIPINAIGQNETTLPKKSILHIQKNGLYFIEKTSNDNNSISQVVFFCFLSKIMSSRDLTSSVSLQHLICFENVINKY